MKELIIAIVLFIVGLILLIKGGDWFVDGSTEIAAIFKIPEILIGATIVAIGTTLPEVMVSATSALSGHGEISYGNAIGSVICNTALIAALTIAIRPSETDKKSLFMPTIFFFAAAGAYALVAYLFGSFYRFMGIILLLVFCLYLFLSAKDAKKAQTLTFPEAEENALSGKERKRAIIKDIILLIVGAALITVGANLLVDNGTIIAKGIGVPESVIALTFIALGTSLPELVTAITALAKGHSSLSLGNLIGANLFNIVFVSGTAITLSSAFAIPTQAFFGFNRSLLVDIPVMFAAMLILTLPPLIKGKLFRWQGIVLLGVYAAFCALQFIF
ncbi:MAG: calcium/sodium antiporter [Clostridia bacterium]|nr:calcium/sodium antiporter [Clostridia bacterium]